MPSIFLIKKPPSDAKFFQKIWPESSIIWKLNTPILWCLGLTWQIMPRIDTATVTLTILANYYVPGILYIVYVYCPLQSPRQPYEVSPTIYFHFIEKESVKWRDKQQRQGHRGGKWWHKDVDPGFWLHVEEKSRKESLLHWTHDRGSSRTSCLMCVSFDLYPRSQVRSQEPTCRWNCSN